MVLTTAGRGNGLIKVSACDLAQYRLVADTATRRRCDVGKRTQMHLIIRSLRLHYNQYSLLTSSVYIVVNVTVVPVIQMQS